MSIVPEKHDISFRRYFRHYRTGKLMDAWAYGHLAWPIGRRRPGR
jgi:hypothetical protein